MQVKDVTPKKSTKLVPVGSLKIADTFLYGNDVSMVCYFNNNKDIVGTVILNKCIYVEVSPRLGVEKVESTLSYQSSN